MHRMTVTFVAVSFALAPTAQAIDIPVREVVATVESTIVDSHATWIAINFGFDADGLGSTLDYQSQVTDSGWSGQLLGDYLGRSVRVDYLGAILDGDEGVRTLNWTSSWTIDGDTYAEIGTGEFAPDRASRFTVTISSGGAVGVSGTFGSWVGNVTIAGVKNPITHTMSGRVRGAVIDIPAVGALAEANGSFTLDQRTGVYSSRLSSSVLFGIWERTLATNHGTLIDHGVASVNEQSVMLQVPAPGALATVALGMLIAVPRRRGQLIP